MESLIAHPPWCRRADCADRGEHTSAPTPMSSAGDLVGIDATLVELADAGVTLVRLTLTDDGEATVFALSLDQAKTLTRSLGDVVDAGTHQPS
ncbi:hypothetical protein AB0J82_21040 [Asanoa sp. NPDC049518]|uniref:hypothetical protein n=1 Tax=unclassified Asanoa TaxID=2685164 RepID=UPI00341A95A1